LKQRADGVVHGFSLGHREGLENDKLDGSVKGMIKMRIIWASPSFIGDTLALLPFLN